MNVQGGKPYYSEFLASDILHSSDWDPAKLNFPLQSRFIKTSLLLDFIHFFVAQETIVGIPADDIRKYDLYIDDTVAIGPGLPQNAHCLEAVIQLAIHKFCRPIYTDGLIPCDNVPVLTKLLAEGALEEIKILLSWQYETRQLIISLSDHKILA